MDGADGDRVFAFRSARVHGAEFGGGAVYLRAVLELAYLIVFLKTAISSRGWPIFFYGSCLFLDQLFVVILGVEHEMAIKTVGSLRRAPGFAEQAIDIGPKHRAGVIEVASRWSNPIPRYFFREPTFVP